MAAAVKACRGARVYCNPSGINRVTYPIDSMRRAFSAHSSPERAIAATTPKRKGRTAPTLPSPASGGGELEDCAWSVDTPTSDSGNRRILRLCCRRRRLRRRWRRVMGVVVVVASTVAPGTASPRAPRKQPEDEEPDQQQPEQAEEGEEAEAVIAAVDDLTAARRRGNHRRRLAGVIGDRPNERGDGGRPEPPDP